MKEVNTTSGKTYSVHTMKGCTIIEPDGWQKTIEAPDGYFDAHFGSVVIEGDDEASIKQVFKLAPQQRLALLGVLGGNADGLPAGYRRVEYIENTSTQHLQLDYVPWGYDSRIKVEMTYDDDTSYGTAFCGSIVKERTYAFLLFLKAMQWRYDESNLSFGTVTRGVKTTFEKNRENNYINGVLVGSNPPATTIWQNNVKVSFFACRYHYSFDTATPQYFMKGRLYSAVGWNADVKQFDLIPCLDPTGAPCMFDRVSRKPFYNQGTGDFLYPTESTTYALRRVLPDWGKLTENGLRRLYHAPAGYQGELIDYALEHGYKPIIEPEKPEEGYWSPRWTETEDEIVLEWVESEPPMEEPLTNN